MNNPNAREKSNSIVIPDFALPSQVVPARKWSGEMRLMYAVLEDAITTYRQYRYDRTRRAQNLALSAHDWITDTNPRWPFSFVNICAALGLDAGWLRKGILDEAAGPLTRYMLREGSRVFPMSTAPRQRRARLRSAA